MNIMHRLLTLSLSCVIFGASSLCAQKAKPEHADTFYTIGKLVMPNGVAPEIGGLDALPDGRIAACFHHGQVAIYQPKDKTWKIFAEGLHEPLGLLVEDEHSILVMQRPELTRLRDTDGDGVCDSYETLWDGFGISGNYHEFAFGPVRAPDGKVVVSLNLASQGDTVFKEVRGQFSDIGVPREKFYEGWKKVSKEVGRMYSRVPFRGWVVKVDPATGAAQPWACGFRSPDGIGFDAQGNLLVDDNQGDWRGTSELFVVKQGGFYGHPASLVWRKDWDGRVPLQVPVADLEKLRTPAAVWFPHGHFANSPTQIVQIPATKAWGPYAGQTIVGEMNSPKILRVLLEEVGGVWQGATLNWIEGETLKRGVHRLLFANDVLYVGRTHLSWAGSEGIGTITPTGKVSFDVLDMKITPKGFRFTFTETLDETSGGEELWTGEHYTYSYHKDYGSPQIAKDEIEVAKVTLSVDRKTAEIELPDWALNHVYEFRFDKLKADSGRLLLNPRIAYTVRRVPQ
jgi:hypothetical protein